MHISCLFCVLIRFVTFNESFRWSKEFELRISRIGMRKVQNRVLKFINDHWKEDIKTYPETDVPKQKDIVPDIYEACLTHNNEKLAELRELEYQKIFIRRNQDRKFTTRWSVLNF
jgi:hypothetical protein